MDFLAKLFAGGLLSGLGSIIAPIFSYLNSKVDASVRIHVADAQTLQTIATGALAGTSAADTLNAQVRLKEGAWSPWVIATIVGFMTPIAWHFWQLELDSSRWIPMIDYAWDWLPYVGVQTHQVGSWKVAALPNGWDATEQTIVSSLFIGATTGAVAHGLIRSIKR